MEFDIQNAHSGGDVEACRQLFREYGEWLNEAVCLTQFAAEVAALPGNYAPPDGGLLLAAVHGEPAGCIAFRRFDATSAEAKRLWVRPQFRQEGLGLALLQTLQTQVLAAGYTRLVFDTLPKMQSALRLYHALGFKPRQGPDPSLLYFEKTL